MTTATLAGAPVLSANIMMPRLGAWTAEVVTGAEEPPTGRVVLDDGGIQFRGTVDASGVDAGRAHALVVAGGGGLQKQLEAAAYRATTAGAVVADILAAAGETLAGDSDAALLKTLLPFWHRDADTAGHALSRLVIDELGASWRSRRDGAIWIGHDDYAEQKLEHVLLEIDEAEQFWVIATERSELLPAVTFENRRVERVIHYINPDSQRTEVWFADVVSGLVPQPASRREQRFLRTYPSTVVAQNADGTVDLLPDDPDMRGRGTQHVKIRHGLPGFKVEIKQGHRVLLGFEAADGTRPYAIAFETNGTLKIGSILIVQNAQSLALLPPQWFAAGAVGDAAAAVALAAAAAAGNLAFLVPITVPIGAVS